jgi:Holliday junction resolvasome RuvABC endonuclease subunit
MDPSLTEFGYAVICENLDSLDSNGQNFFIQEMDSIKTNKSEKVKQKLKKNTNDTTDRLIYIASILSKLIKDYDIKFADFEIPVGSKSAIAGNALAGVRGLVVGICTALSLEIKTIEAREVKILLTGNRDAEKQEILNYVEDRVPTFLKHATKYTKAKKFACADAVAVYLAIQKQTN